MFKLETVLLRLNMIIGNVQFQFSVNSNQSNRGNGPPTQGVGYHAKGCITLESCTANNPLRAPNRTPLYLCLAPLHVVTVHYYLWTPAKQNMETGNPAVKKK
jgi:hypothetical protein